jgi:hypothetical protein
LDGGDEGYRLLVEKLLESSYLHVPKGTLYTLGIIHPIILAHSENQDARDTFLPI